MPVAIGFLGVSGVSSPTAYGQTYPPGFTGTTLVSSGLLRPVRICLHPDGRVFIALQNGAVRIWKEGVGLLPTPYYQFPTQATSEGGLIGMALSPDPASEFSLFAFYANAGPARVVSIRAANPADDVAIPNSETLLISPYTGSHLHYGGGLQFGVDGKLYISTGDGGVGNSQSLADLRGKMLRINSDGSIPADNPTSFAGITGTTAGENRAIYAVGFRNPFHLAIHPVTGRLFVNDVGSSEWEEVNECFGGKNFGFPLIEGPSNATTPPYVTPPRYSYENGWAVVGGVFYNPPVCTFPPEYFSSYLFADYAMSWIKRLNIDSNSVASFATSIGGVTDMEVDPQGRMYLLRHDAGRLIRLEYTDPLPPALVRQPKPVRLCAGEVARFSSVPSGTLPLAYQWRHDNVDLIDNARISGANTPELTINDVHSVDTGLYQCFISNVHGNVLTAAAELSLGMTGGSRTGLEIARFIATLQSGTSNETDLCHFDFDADGTIDMDDVPGLVSRLLQ